MIGTVIAAEFVLMLTVSIAFFAEMGWKAFTTATLGLLVGGVLAAPIGAVVAKRMPTRAALVLVGLVLAAVSLFGIFKIVG